jgi:broad specificity phosphatase PhoE
VNVGRRCGEPFRSVRRRVAALGDHVRRMAARVVVVDGGMTLSPVIAEQALAGLER